MELNDNVIQHKIVVLGDMGVGKTSIINRWMYKRFDPVHSSTIGIDFLSKTIKHQDHTIRIQVWDTAGQERFRAVIPSYIRDASMAIVVYDITHMATFLAIDKWINDIKQNSEECLIILVGNKSDCDEESRCVPYKDAEAKAQQLGINFVESSARSGDNIEKIFQIAVTEINASLQISHTKIGKTIHLTPEKQAPSNITNECKC